MIVTERLDLIPATPALTRAALESDAALAAALGVIVPPSWPPEYLDAPALEFTLARLAEGPRHAGWWLHFVVLRDERELIGSAGYVGPPSDDGTVEVGYGIVADRQRRGYASEAVRGMVARAFSAEGVWKVVAHTLPDLTPSIGVLRKCGFTLVGSGAEPGTIRFVLLRSDFAPPDSRGSLDS